MICVVGIGNVLRNDDGVGPYIVSQIEAMELPGVITFMSQQLNLEFIDEFVEFDQVLIVDAAIIGDDVEFYSLKDSHVGHLASSHHVSAQMFLLLAKRMYGKELDMYVCSVKGENFNMGENLSETAQVNAQKAIEKITSFLRSQAHA